MGIYSQQYLVGNICHGRQGLFSTGRGHAAVHCHGYHPGCDETHRTTRGLGVACQHPGDGEKERGREREEVGEEGGGSGEREGGGEGEANWSVWLHMANEIDN